MYVGVYENKKDLSINQIRKKISIHTLRSSQSLKTDISTIVYSWPVSMVDRLAIIWSLPIINRVWFIHLIIIIIIYIWHILVLDMVRWRQSKNGNVSKKRCLDACCRFSLIFLCVCVWAYDIFFLNLFSI